MLRNRLAWAKVRRKGGRRTGGGRWAYASLSLSCASRVDLLVLHRLHASW